MPAVSTSTTPAVSAGRPGQRRRTRAAIVAATMELVREGAEPSIGEIADAAEVSRRTVYQHFASLDQLLIDAHLGLLSHAAVDDAIEAADSGDPEADALARVDRLVQALGGLAGETLPLGRRLIRLTVTAPHDGPGPKRGYRRVAWIERAVAPLRDQLDDAAYERLVSGLAMVLGWEALIVLADLRDLEASEQTETSAWAARTLIRAALEESS
jgi:AcrR family transcriptional regulator